MNLSLRPVSFSGEGNLISPFLIQVFSAQPRFSRLAFGSSRCSEDPRGNTAESACTPGGKELRPARAQPWPSVNIDIFFPLGPELASTCPDSGRLQVARCVSKAGTESSQTPGVRTNCAIPTAGGAGELGRIRPAPARRHLSRKRPPPSLPTTLKARRRGSASLRAVAKAWRPRIPAGPGYGCLPRDPAPAGPWTAQRELRGCPSGEAAVESPDWGSGPRWLWRRGGRTW